MNFDVEMGKRIRLLRETRRLSQQALAERAGLSKAFISQLERGKTGIGLNSLEKLGQALETPGHLIMNHELWKREHLNQIAERGALEILERAKKIEPEHLDYMLDNVLGTSARAKGVEEWMETYRILKDLRSKRRRGRR